MSYSRSDESAVKTLARAFEAAHRTVWFDHDLRGGDIWWDTILRNIRDSSLFLFAMSDHSLGSKACLAELEYAEALKRPILPVQVGPVAAERSHLLAGRHYVSFRPDDAIAGAEVIDAADSATKGDVPLPDPLPAEPPIPFAYLGLIRRRIEGEELDNAAQLEVIGQLRRSLGEETDASARRDILAMLETLRDRPWRTIQAGLEIHAVFAGYEAIEREIAGAPTVPIRLPDGVEVPKLTPEWSEIDAREAFLRRIEEVVGELQAGKACQEARRSSDPPSGESPFPGVEPDQGDGWWGPTAEAGHAPGNAAKFFPGVGLDQEDDEPGFSRASGAVPSFGEPAVDPDGGSFYPGGANETISPTGTAATSEPEPRRFPGVGPEQPFEPAHQPPPVASTEQPTSEPGTEDGGTPEAPVRPVPPPSSNPRAVAIAALVVSVVFGVLVVLIDRAATAVIFVLPAAIGMGALAFSTQAGKRAAAGNETGSRRASMLAMVWGGLAVAVAVAALAVILNTTTPTG